MLKRIIITLFCFQALMGSALADALDAYPSLRESHDPGLQSGLQKTLKHLHLARAVARGKLAVTLVDITDLEDPRVASVNGDEMIYAASLPKIAILLGAFVEIERGRMQLDDQTRASLTRMVRHSSNRDATTMLNRIGKPRLAEILQSERFRLYDPLVNGGLWVGKDYGKAAAWKRDPLHHLSHGATAMQVARFYYLLETEQLLAPRWCREMKKILSHSGIHHKFVKGLDNKPGSRIYRKSGTWHQWHADSAIVERDGHRYILVALAEDRRGGQWLADLISPLDDLIIPPRRIALAR